jgi:LytS/YehU family sensor histidine kinase
MIRDYVELERVRYGTRLQLDEVADDAQEHGRPLLMIPFVENSFKHGASKTLKRPWIKRRHAKGSAVFFTFRIADQNPNHQQIEATRPKNVNEGYNCYIRPLTSGYKVRR